MPSSGFFHAMFDSLPNEAAVLDESASIVVVNEAWRQFANNNGGEKNGNHYVGWNYLDVCRNAVQVAHDGVINEIATGLEDMVHGHRASFHIEYAFTSDPDSNWFDLVASRFTEGDNLFVLVQHHDITQRKRAALKQEETDAMLRGVLDALPVGIWIMNSDGNIIDGNPAGQSIWGGARYVGTERFAEYKGWWLDTGRLIEAHEWAAARAIREGETTINEELMIETFDGLTRKVILNSAIPLRDDNGAISGAIIVNQDITSRKLMEDMLRNAGKAVEDANRELREVLSREQAKARTDELTKIANRRHFFDLANELFSVADRYEESLAVIIFDVDHFKQFNDLFGHDVGDMVLREVAQLAHAQMRQPDVIGRYGGEEFVAVLPNTDAHGATVVAENIRRQIAGWRGEVNGKRLQVSVSLGVAERMAGDDRIENVIKRADQALHLAKSAGRNCTRIDQSTFRRASKPPGDSRPRRTH